MANNAAQLGGPGGPEDLDPNVQAPALELVETANESADTTTAVADGTVAALNAYTYASNN